MFSAYYPKRRQPPPEPTMNRYRTVSAVFPPYTVSEEQLHKASMFLFQHTHISVRILSFHPKCVPIVTLHCSTMDETHTAWRKKSSGLGIWLTFLWTQNTPFHCHFGLVLSGAKMSTFFQEYRNKMLRLQLSLFQSHFFILTSFKLQRERTNSSWHQSYLFSLQEKEFLLQFPVPPAGTVHFLLASVCFCALGSQGSMPTGVRLQVIPILKG